MSNAWTLYSVVLLLVCFSVVSFSANAIKRPISFDDALHSSYMPDVFNGSWISDTEYLYELDYSGEIIKYNVESGTVVTLVNKTILDAYNISEVTTSADGKWLAIGHDDTSVFRHSKMAKFTLFELETGNKVELADGQKIQLLVWAPVGHAFAFVQDNDVFYQSVHYPTPNTQRITNTSDSVFNGIADWVYEEEVLEDTKALWFSPDGKKMVFTSMDDTDVRNVTLWRYNDPGSLESQYVEPVVVRYPKAGTSNPTTTLNYVDLEKSPISYVPVATPVDLVSNDNVLAAVAWADDTHFSPTWLTRLQTKGYTLLCNSQDLKCSQMFEHIEKKGWLDIKRPVFINQTAFLTVLPRDQGGQNGNYRQLCLVSADRTVALTSGLDVVVDILSYDKKTGTVYYTSTANHDSAQRHVYALTVDGKGSAKCLSCENGCQYGGATFSHNASYYVLSCLGPSPPISDLYNRGGQKIKHLVDNKNLEEELKNNVDMPIVRNLEVPVSENYVAKVRIYLPSGLVEDGRTKYPLLFNVYSGPNSNKISDLFKTPSYDEYLVTSRGIILVNMDGRGSGLRGDNIKFEMYHKLGGPEIEDILIVAGYLQKKFPCVDVKRTAIWGWSYGGYATAMTLAKDTDQLFKCGLSVAPVTSWLYYDTIYTERYMGLPTNDSNLEGYKASDVTSKVDNFRHKMYYLIHGNFDDNVHYQQSMALSKALERADILFSQQSYPDETHALAHVRRHLYHSMDKFWTKCFQLKEPIYKEYHSRSGSRDSNSSRIGGSSSSYDYSSSSGSQYD